MRKRLLVLYGVSCMAVMAVAGNAWAAGNSDAAQSCQKGGYMTMTRADNTGFKNTGDCVSYFAQTNKAAACTVTATTGCLTFDNVVLTEGSYTLTLNASYSFNSTCNDDDVLNLCPSDTLNNYATGGGTYTITDGATVLEQGTLTTAFDQAAQYQGLANPTSYADSGGSATTCSAGIVRQVNVYSSTGVGTDASAEVGVFSVPGTSLAIFTTIDSIGFEGPSAGVTLAC